MKMKDGYIVVIEPYKAPEVREVKNFELEDMQAIVGGYIELLRVTNDIDMYFNEEGKLKRLPPNFWIFSGRDMICGTAFLCSHDDDGNEVLFTQAQAEHIARACEALKRISEEEAQLWKQKYTIIEKPSP